jgi:transcriptional regulator of nitric oxide reductase
MGRAPNPSGGLRDTIVAVRITDTSPSAEAVQLQVQRAMTGEQRLLMAFEMSMFARDLASERIRREHPGWTETQVARELIRLAFLPAPMPEWLRRRP